MLEQKFNFAQARAYSAQYGIHMSIYWVISFICTMNAMEYPLLSFVGQITAFLSLFIGIRIVSEYSSKIQKLGFLNKVWLSWSTCAFATIITTLAQYIYMRFIDKGRFINSITEIFNDPAYKEIIEQQMQGLGTEKALEILSATTYTQLALQFLFLNLCIAMLFTLLMSLFAKTKPNVKP